MAESETQEIFVTGLRNAHAMENQALWIMKPQLERIESYPEERKNWSNISARRKVKSGASRGSLRASTRNIPR